MGFGERGREGRGEKEGNADVRNTHQLLPLRVPLGTKPTPWGVP